MNLAKLKGRMAELGMSQAKLAGILGMSENALSSRFTGRVDFGMEEVTSICDALDISNSADIISIFFNPRPKNETQYNDCTTD